MAPPGGSCDVADNRLLHLAEPVAQADIYAASGGCRHGCLLDMDYVDRGGSVRATNWNIAVMKRDCDGH